MEKETLIKKIKRFDQTIKKSLPDEMSVIGKIALFFDFTNEYLFHGVYLQDYIQYGFYWKKNRERRKYIVHGRLIEMMQICNNPEKRYIFDHKPEFDRKFSDYLQRDYLDFQDATEEDFRVFLKNNEHFFIKQPDGMFGTGIKKVYIKDISDLTALFRDYKKKKYLCEETLTQCKEMAEFNNTSINTLRIVTIRKADGEVKIMGGLIRVGRKGRIADNFHHMGIAAFLDPLTGIISTTGIDKNNVRHVIHPDTGKKIVGFQIPVWNDVVDTVTKAANVVPDVRYIGWDVVITQDYRVALVEGNPGADPDAEQITTKEGRWPLYWEYLREIKDLKTKTFGKFR